MTNALRDIEWSDRGMKLRQFPLWLDANRKQDVSFVSHAHSDHIARHRQSIGTKRTLALMQHRLGELESVVALEYGQEHHIGPVKVELFSAGHVLGSAQVRMTVEGKRIVYTGDLNVTPALTVEPVQVAECDVLVIESTFGHPRYKFPPRAEVFGMLRRFVERCRTYGQVPVVLGYALGKAQEAVKFLGDCGYPLVAHESIQQTCDVYTANGMELPPVRRFDGEVKPGEVLFFPPHLRRGHGLEQVGSIRTVMLTGWALDPPTHARYGAHEMLPLSDHADFDTLIDYTLKTGAKQVFTVHGFCKDLAAALRERGLDAQPLQEVEQLELF